MTDSLGDRIKQLRDLRLRVQLGSRPHRCESAWISTVMGRESSIPACRMDECPSRAALLAACHPTPLRSAGVPAQ